MTFCISGFQERHPALKYEKVDGGKCRNGRKLYYAISQIEHNLLVITGADVSSEALLLLPLTPPTTELTSLKSFSVGHAILRVLEIRLEGGSRIGREMLLVTAGSKRGLSSELQSYLSSDAGSKSSS